MQRVPVHVRRAVLAAAALIALAVAGCGSSSSPGAGTPVRVDPQTRAYLQTMCTATIPVVNDFGAFRPALARSKSQDLVTYKHNVVRLISSMSAHAENAVGGLQHAGTPSIHGGAGFARAVSGEFGAFHTALVQALASAKAVPTINPYQFGLALGGMQAALGQALTRAGKTVNAISAKLNVPSLTAAERTIPACQPAH